MIELFGNSEWLRLKGDRMKEKPILFNAAMVRAILDGRKTQTRRILKMPVSGGLHEPWQVDQLCTITSPHPQKGKWGMMVKRPLQMGDDKFERHMLPCPYGRVGDELWVRETFGYIGIAEPGEESTLIYRADGEQGIKWKPSIFMPKIASRIRLRITDIRVERVADISDGDALREGIKPSDVAARGYCDARVAFKVLWNSINTDPGKTWADNPWVWVVEFERVTP